MQAPTRLPTEADLKQVSDQLTGLDREPAVWERLLLHALYLASVGVVPAFFALRILGKSKAFQLRDVFLFLLAVAGCYTFRYLIQSGGVHPWFASHFTRLISTYGYTAIAVLCAPVVALTALFITPYMLYVAFAIFALSILWFEVRNVIGYIRFLRGAPAF